MKISNDEQKLVQFITRPFRVTDGDRFRLAGIDHGDTLQFDSEDKPRAQEALKRGGYSTWRRCRTASTRRIAGRCC